MRRPAPVISAVLGPTSLVKGSVKLVSVCKAPYLAVDREQGKALTTLSRFFPCGGQAKAGITGLL